MRRSEDEIFDPEVVAQLDAIDATLAGEAVDPRHADLAELALLLAAGRPELDVAFASELDGRVADRFGPRSKPASAVPESGPRRTGFSWPSLPVLGGALAAGAAAVVAVVALGPGGSPTPGSSTAAVERRPATMTSASSSASAGGAASAVAKAVPSAVFDTGQRAVHSAPAPAASGGTVTTVTSASSTASAFNPGALTPSANGRKIVQSAQLALSTGPAHVDDVAQEIFNVVGSVHGIVSRSNVTATGAPDGYAHFELSLPSAGLPDAMGRLSRLRYASVSSRTDSTQDVNGSFVSAGRRLGDARALRTALLKQLALATTAVQISSLHAQIRDAENTIAQAQADLRSLNHRVDYSSVSVTVAASQSAQASSGRGSSSGFTLHRALHDAGRVLIVAAGVALITLAVLVPVGLVGLLGWWGAASLRRRRREHALDLA